MPDPPGNISTLKILDQKGSNDPEQVPALTIVSHAALSRAGERFVLDALLTGKEVAISRMAPDFKRCGAPSGKPLEDPGVSRKPFTVAPAAGGGVVLRVEDGGTTVEVNGQRVAGEREIGPAALAVGVPVVLSGRVVLLLHLVEADQRLAGDDLGMVGDSDALHQVREQIRSVVAFDAPVLLRGESGTGKEKVAEALHRLGPRRRGRLVSISLPALAKELATSELFGAKRGAYSGAEKDRDGFFLAAQGGTLFLDEVGEASQELQSLLLRVLETNELYPLGSHVPVKVDFRLISATDADLEALVQDSQFRLPLLHRLKGYQIRLPALRERREDLGQLFAHFAREELEKIGEAEKLSPADPRAEPWLPANLALAMLRYDWPGNIRELRSITRTLIIDSRGRPGLKANREVARQLGLASPGPMTPATPLVVPADPNATPAPRRKPSDVSKQELEEMLLACEWEPQAAADRLVMARSSIYLLMTKYGIPTAVDLSAEAITNCHRECGGKLGEMVQRLRVSRQGLKRRCKELKLEVDET